MNRVELSGRLTKDVEVRKTSSGLSVASFTVAVDRYVSDKSQNQQTADFLNCAAWRQSADYLGKYGGKGDWIEVEGRLQSRSYEDRDGKTVFVTEVVADSVKLIRTQKSSGTADSSSHYTEQASLFDKPSPARHNGDDLPF